MSETPPSPLSTVFVHDSAVVDPGARIGAGTRIWHFCHVMSGAQIGEGCILGQNVFISGRARVGSRVRIQNNVSIYDGVVLEDDVFCGPSVVFTNVLYPRAAYPRDRDTGFSLTKVGRGVTLGANSTIVCGVEIGTGAFVGAGSTVTCDVGEYVIAYGCPAIPRGWICGCGERLTFERQSAVCGACGAAFVRDEASRVQRISEGGTPKRKDG